MKIPLWLILLVSGGIAGARAEVPVTVVEIGEEVLVPGVRRFGINLGGDSYYNGAMMKRRVVRNFEGTSYRQIFNGPGDTLEAGGFFSYVQVPVKRGWPELMKGCDATILSGPLAGTKVKIREVAEQERAINGRTQKGTYFSFEQPVELPPDSPKLTSQALLVERLALDEGQIGPVGTFWASDNCLAFAGDVPPGSSGRAVLKLDASRPQEKPKAGAAEAFMRFPTHYQRFGNTNGLWHVRFKAKAAEGAPGLVVRSDGFGQDATVELSGEWKTFDLEIPVDKVPEPKDAKDNPHLTFTFAATGGAVLVDDVEIWMDGDKNPTPFRDDFVDALKFLEPGIIRRLVMGGDTMENFLKPRIEAFATQNNLFADPGPQGNGPERLAFGLYEGLELCEFLGSEPWLCVPGTLQPDEMDILMEFLGGPEATPGGKLRAQWGHPKPWTESFRAIHVEFGNEAWNTIGAFLAGGYNGPDYWKGLIARGKASAHYSPVVVFHAAGQNVQAHMTRRILSETPNADRYAIAVYQVHGLDPEDLVPLDTDDKLFRWLFAYPLQEVLVKGLPEQVAASKAAGIPLSQYEVNHHITGGKAPAEPRDKLVASAGGAVNIANAMLLMLRECGMREQCFFTFQQVFYDAPGVGRVRLWGANLSQRPGELRYRPTGLALAAMNRVLGGDMVATKHTGANPVFEATGKLPGAAQKGEAITVEHPVLWSYAFADGKRRAAILVNLDTQSPHPVALKFSGKPVAGSAKRWRLSAKHITDTNEFEAGEPQVALVEEPLPAFAAGSPMELAPFSLQAIEWEVE